MAQAILHHVSTDRKAMEHLVRLFGFGGRQDSPTENQDNGEWVKLFFPHMSEEKAAELTTLGVAKLLLKASGQQDSEEDIFNEDDVLLRIRRDTDAWAKMAAACFPGKGAPWTTPIHVASLLGHTHVLKQLVGMNFDSRTYGFLSREARAICSEQVDLISQVKVPLETSDAQGITPLFAAVLGNQKGSLDLLVSAGVDIFGRSEQLECTAAQLAVRCLVDKTFLGKLLLTAIKQMDDELDPELKFLVYHDEADDASSDGSSSCLSNQTTSSSTSSDQTTQDSTDSSDEGSSVSLQSQEDGESVITNTSTTFSFAGSMLPEGSILHDLVAVASETNRDRVEEICELLLSASRQLEGKRVLEEQGRLDDSDDEEEEQQQQVKCSVAPVLLVRDGRGLTAFELAVAEKKWFLATELFEHEFNKVDEGWFIELMGDGAFPLVSRMLMHRPEYLSSEAVVQAALALEPPTHRQLMLATLFRFCIHANEQLFPDSVYDEEMAKPEEERDIVLLRLHAINLTNRAIMMNKQQRLVNQAQDATTRLDELLNKMGAQVSEGEGSGVPVC